MYPKQELVIIQDPKWEEIQSLLINENIIIITYSVFSKILYKYIYLSNIFLIQENIWKTINSDLYIIEDNIIKYKDNILKNDCSINNKSYILNKYQLESIKTYNYLFQNNININSLSDCLLYKYRTLKSSNFNNIYARLRRLREYTSSELSNKLEKLFENNKYKFLEVQSEALMTNNFQDRTVDIKIKMIDEIYIYDYYGYSTFLDTFTKYYFYCTPTNQDLIQYYKILKEYEIVTLFYSILNYNLANNIHRKTNIYNKIYNKLIDKLDTILKGK